TEAGSGMAVTGAVVRYRPRADNKAALADANQTALALETVVLSGDDGSFRMPVLPGPGHLLLKGPASNFIQIETTTGELDGDKPASKRLYPDGLAALDLKPDAGPHDVKVTLRRGVTVRGQVVKPDGKPAGKGVVVCRTFTYGGISFYESRLEFHDGRFELTGLDPAKTYPVFFLDGDNGLGAVTEVSGKQAGKPVTVRLKPCGSATTRLVDEEGRPFADHAQLSGRPAMHLALIVTPGAAPAQRKEVQADSIRVLNMVSYFHVRTDAEGRIQFPLLIPGATYRLLASEGTRGFCGKRDIRVEPGQELKLPDVVIERPRCPPLAALHQPARLTKRWPFPACSRLYYAGDRNISARSTTMATVQPDIVLRPLRGLATDGAGQPLDSELLDRFMSGQEASAFEALVRRHGPLVLGVCRRVLGNPHDAEDAFQTTFLTLAR